MDNLDEKIERLTALFQAMETPTQNESDNEHMDNESIMEEPQEVIYDYGTSEDENPYDNPYYLGDDGGPEGNPPNLDDHLNPHRRHGINPPPQPIHTDWNESKTQNLEEYLQHEPARRGYLPKKGKNQFIPIQYRPRITRPREDKNQLILNIDCETDTLAAIEDWTKNLAVHVQLNPDLNGISGRDLYNYIMYHVGGIALAYLSSKTEDEINATYLFNKNQILNNTPIQILAAIESDLILEFVGLNNEDPRSYTLKQDEAMWHISRMGICNMCDVKSFICEYRKYFYELTAANKAIATELFYKKFPRYVSMEVAKQHALDISGRNLPDNLGSRITTLENWLKIQCTKNLAQKEAKIDLCCSKVYTKPGRYGCQTPFSKGGET